MLVVCALIMGACWTGSAHRDGAAAAHRATPLPERNGQEQGDEQGLGAVVVLRVIVVDGATGARVPAAVGVVADDGQRALTGRAEVAGDGLPVVLPMVFSGWMEIEAPGYDVVRLRLRYAVDGARVLDVPVRLARLRDGYRGDKVLGLDAR